MTREKKTKKGRAVATRKLYCSKFVAKILDKLIETELARVTKHQRTASKWLAKMRSSVLKKISSSTRVLFAREDDDMNELRRKIAAIQNSLLEEKNRIVQTAQDMWKNKISDFAKQSDQSSSAPGMGIFDSQVQLINGKLDMMASQLSSLSKDADSRVAAFGNTLQVVEAAWGSTSSSPRAKRPRGRPEKSSPPAADDDGVLPPPPPNTDGEAVMISSRGRPIQAVSRLLSNP